MFQAWHSSSGIITCNFEIEKRQEVTWCISHYVKHRTQNNNGMLSLFIRVLAMLPCNLMLIQAFSVFMPLSACICAFAIFSFYSITLSLMFVVLIQMC